MYVYFVVNALIHTVYFKLEIVDNSFSVKYTQVVNNNTKCGISQKIDLWALRILHPKIELVYWPV